MSKLTIVIIEDEKNILSFIEAALETHDYKVLTAVSGKEGLSLINACCPDMILLDLGLPDLDGIDIIKNVRSWSNIPIIVISARTQEQEKVAALDFGADDYITKLRHQRASGAHPHRASPRQANRQHRGWNSCSAAVPQRGSGHRF